MQSSEDILCIFSFLQIITGVFGNFLFLYLNGFNLITTQRIRPIDLIFINLAFSHILLILFKGTPTAFQLCKQAIILGDVECKIIVYLQRVSRSLSLCSSCFLSVYQVIAISSVSSKCAGLKGRILNSIVPSCIFIWILNLLFDMNVPWYVTGSINKTNSDLHMNMGYCSIDWHALIVSKMMTLKTLYDAVFLGFLAIASGYLVLVLYRHHWQVQHIHNTKLNPSISPVISATKVILLLMIIFISFYSASSIFVNVVDYSKGKTLWMIHFSVFLNLCYPTICPFVLINKKNYSSLNFGCNYKLWSHLSEQEGISNHHQV
uniref:Vomeronasal type-1 receptor n=1 Tax=Sarcophilus harrisii TaxID=9305 RepID=A0A7N4UZZ2_SARHA